MDFVQGQLYDIKLIGPNIPTKAIGTIVKGKYEHRGGDFGVFEVCEGEARGYYVWENHDRYCCEVIAKAKSVDNRIALALEVIKANHQFHLDHDTDGLYIGSQVHDVNVETIKRLES